MLLEFTPRSYELNSGHRIMAVIFRTFRSRTYFGTKLSRFTFYDTGKRKCYPLMTTFTTEKVSNTTITNTNTNS